MKRLFCVKDKNSKLQPLGTFGNKDEPVYTDDKQHAKHVRDELGGVKAGYHVSRGPDHIGKHSGFGVPRMRRQPK